MDAWIAGGTGLVGRALVDQLLARPEMQRVTSLVRRAEHVPHPRLTELIVDFDHLEASLAGLTPTHAFCCLGTTMAKAGSEEAFRRVDYDYPLAFARAARAASARSFSLVSALGAKSSSSIFYNRVKGEIEAAITALDFPTLHIARPALLFGERAEHRAGESLAIALGRPLGRLLVGPLKRYAPIAGEDVAKAMVLLAESDARGTHVHESDELARLVLR